MTTSETIRRDAESCKNKDARECLLSIAKALDAGMELEDCIALLKSVRKRKKNERTDKDD